MYYLALTLAGLALSALLVVKIWTRRALARFCAEARARLAVCPHGKKSMAVCWECTEEPDDDEPELKSGLPEAAALATVTAIYGRLDAEPLRFRFGGVVNQARLEFDTDASYPGGVYRIGIVDGVGRIFQTVHILQASCFRYCIPFHGQPLTGLLLQHTKGIIKIRLLDGYNVVYDADPATLRALLA